MKLFRQKLTLSLLIGLSVSILICGCNKQGISDSVSADADTESVSNEKYAELIIDDQLSTPLGDILDESIGSSAQTVPGLTPEPTPSPTPKPTPTPEPTPTAVPSPTPKPSPTPAESMYKGYPGTVQNVYNGELPEFPGKAYAVADADTGEILLAYNADQSIYPASTIKLLTAITAVENARLFDMFTVNGDTVAGIDYDVWTAGLPGGTELSLRTLLNLMLIQSYGDAAAVIAESIGGTVDDYVGMMNQWAQYLGMTDTYVDNPIGLDIGNEYNEIRTTAYDIITLTKAFARYPVLMDISGTADYVVPAADWLIAQGKETTIKNSCLMVSDTEKYGSSLYKVLAGKTGYTIAAGRCLVTVTEDINGRRYAFGVFGCPSTNSCAEFQKSILEYIISAQ